MVTSLRVLYRNSSELAHGLDAHGFSDLEKSVQYHVLR